jgi:hypothetical protein
MNRFACLAVIIAATWTTAVTADTVDARCDIYPKGEDHASAMLACTFSQRQGYVTITRADGVTHELSPVDDTPGNYKDQNGGAVYRQSGLADEGLIFRLPQESVYVYWGTAVLQPQADTDNPTTPFTTSDYDATTLLRCRAVGAADFSTCPAGILRMEGDQASVVVKSPAGEQFTINFMTDYVNATNGEVKAELNDDTWTVTTDKGEIYEVPIAALIGG